VTPPAVALTVNWPPAVAENIPLAGSMEPPLADQVNVG